jgi:hypothetical protein
MDGNSVGFEFVEEIEIAVFRNYYQLSMNLLSKDSSVQRWNRSGFLTTGTGTALSRSDRTGRSTGNDLSTGDRPVYQQTGRSEIQTGTGSISADFEFILNEYWLLLFSCIFKSDSCAFAVAAV